MGIAYEKDIVAWANEQASWGSYHIAAKSAICASSLHVS
jgi:hypothetical protein